MRDSQFPAAQSITYFARALGGSRAGDLAAARVEIGHLDEIEAGLIAVRQMPWRDRHHHAPGLHEDDLVGHALGQEPWEVLSFPNPAIVGPFRG